MSKEEILGKHWTSDNGIDWDDAEAAMDEYAKQEAIGFAEWADNNWWKFNRLGNYWFRWAKDGEERLSAEQIHQLYLQSKTINNERPQASS